MKVLAVAVLVASAMAAPVEERAMNSVESEAAPATSALLPGDALRMGFMYNNMMGGVPMTTGLPFNPPIIMPPVSTPIIMPPVSTPIIMPPMMTSIARPMYTLPFMPRVRPVMPMAGYGWYAGYQKGDTTTTTPPVTTPPSTSTFDYNSLLSAISTMTGALTSATGALTGATSALTGSANAVSNVIGTASGALSGAASALTNATSALTGSASSVSNVTSALLNATGALTGSTGIISSISSALTNATSSLTNTTTALAGTTAALTNASSALTGVTNTVANTTGTLLGGVTTPSLSNLLCGGQVLYTQPQCCGASILGVASVTCSALSGTNPPASVAAFKTLCSATGQTASCCSLSAAGVSLACTTSI
ncbi:hypothetical protein HIM_08708 [Hirsutella minnesotensis 3608]|uniref:Hydrophobin n=1 Tax=Hirsutella minnesotensis 3608 TaxID=1043627 RepID=A0A0F7ZSS3_9HYPO|nr:hypothetical protein HIM_08708 [Hirsutella minnesotensis 3608]